MFSLDDLYGSLSSDFVAWCGVAPGLVSLVALRLAPVAARKLSWWRLTPIRNARSRKVNEVNKHAASDAVGALGKDKFLRRGAMTIVRLNRRQATSDAHEDADAYAACEVYLAISGVRDALGCARRVADSAMCSLEACETAPDVSRVPGRWKLSSVVLDTEQNSQSRAVSPPDPSEAYLVEWSRHAETFLRQGGGMVMRIVASDAGTAKVRIATTSAELRDSWIKGVDRKYRAIRVSAWWTPVLLGPLVSLPVGAVMVGGALSLLGSGALAWVSPAAYVLGWISIFVSLLCIGVQLFRSRLHWIIRSHAQLPLGLRTRYRGGMVHASHVGGWAKPRCPDQDRAT